jgi:ATP-dependent Lon protease
MKNIIHQSLNLPADAPVMVLPNALLFPNALLPLYIFEERYRSMLQFCLGHNRMFCIALMKSQVSDAVEDDDFFHVAGLGLIRACVGNDDGTSQLILQGLARVKFKNFVQQKPFRVAQIHELPSKAGNTVEAEALSAKVIEICRSLKEKTEGLENILNNQIAASANPEAVSDFIAQAFVRDPFQRQEILEELSVCRRLRLLISHLQQQEG